MSKWYQIFSRETTVEHIPESPAAITKFLPFNKFDLPNIVENKNKDYVQLGKNHDYTQRLAELYKSCAIHGSIIRKKQLMVTGKGWYVDNMPLENYIDQAQVSDSLRVSEFFRNPAGQNDLNEVLSRVALDYEIYGAFALEIIYTKDTFEWNEDGEIIGKSENVASIAAINHFPVKNVCPGRKNEDECIEHYYWSKDWSDSKCKPECFAAYDPEKPTPRQLLYVFKYDGDLDYFGTPRYIAAVTDIEARAEMSVFQANNVKEGFAPSVVIKYYQEPKTQEEADFIAKGLAKSFQGSKGKKLMVVFGNGKELTPDITPVAAQNVDKQFTQLVSDTSESIVSAHGVTNQLLMGISTPGKLGGDSSLAESYMIFVQDEIVPTQTLIAKTFGDLAKRSGVDRPISIASNEFVIAENKPAH